MRSVPLLLFLCIACTPRPAATSAPAAASTATLGSTRETAIEVCEPRGERAYLSRLRCADGKAPAYRRIGSVGMRTTPKTAEDEEMATGQLMAPVPPGQPDFHTLDLYEVKCGDTATELFLDMYHCDKPAPNEAPAGFTIV